ncbi:hypothetical protein Q9K02_07980 [Qipengyuania sp. G39]|uniref:Thiamine biosynthesis protein ThiC n=1 Tax=Qipengyuania profundimaris TaxID=3067652 RepID=A0ABT9HPJ3_9SPHN|nr:hypothetical protein [Qipengyuania sp. G39]MDP4575070.1 hypothetical protein [Qipengyuania sp. G39]
MADTDRAPTRLLAIALLVTVASQLFYITVVSSAGPETVLRPITWLTELFAFLSTALAAFTLAVRRPDQAALWVALAVAGIFNVMQVAIGLSMFGPASDGEPQLMATVLAGAFFLYFLAKVLMAGAGIVLGLIAARGTTTVTKVLGGLTVLAGLAGAVLNFFAMIDPKAWMFGAGASGTAVTAFLAVVLLLDNSASRGVPTSA